MNQEIIVGLIGIFIGSFISFLSTFLILRNNLKLEKMKIHANDKIKYYQKLYIFNRSLNYVCRPDSERIVSEFSELMENGFSELIFGYPYYSKKIIDLLIKLDNLRTCLFIDVDWVTAPKKEIEKKIPMLQSQLNGFIINEFKSWTI
jgi:hypothetical protein